MNVCKEIIQIQNRIAYNLSGAVIGNITPTVDLIELCSFGGELLFGGQEIGNIAALTQSVYTCGCSTNRK